MRRQQTRQTHRRALGMVQDEHSAVQSFHGQYEDFHAYEDEFYIDHISDWIYFCQFCHER